MPIKIPLYEKRTQGRGGPVPGVRVRAELQEAQALSGVAQSVGQLSEVGQQVAIFGEKVREEQERAAQMGATSDLYGVMTRGLDDSKTGFLTKKGKAAGAEYKGTLEAFDKEVEKISKGLGTDRQRANFRQMVGKQRASFQQSMDRHVARESEKLARENYGAVLGGIQSNAFGRIGREELDKIPGDVVEGLVLIKGEGLRLNKSDAEIGRQALAFTTTLHISILDDLLTRGETGVAGEYFKAYKGSIEPQALADAQIEARLKAGSREDEELAVAAALFDTFDGDMGKIQDELETQRVDGVIDAGFYDAVLKRGMNMRRQKDVVIDAHDLPFASGLTETLVTTGDFSDTDPRWIQIESDETRADLLKDRAIWRQKLRMEKQDRLNFQALLLRQVLADYGQIPSYPGDVPEHEENQIDLDVPKKYRGWGLDKMGMDIVKGTQKRDIEGFKRDGGLSKSQFKDRIMSSVLASRKPKELLAMFMARFSGWQATQVALKKDPAADVPLKVIEEWEALWGISGEEVETAWYAIDDDMTYLGAQRRDMPFRSDKGVRLPSVTAQDYIIRTLRQRGINPTTEKVIEYYQRDPDGYEEEARAQ